MNRFLLTLALALFMGSPLAAGTIVQRKGSATLELRFENEQPSLSLADLLSVTLTVEGDESLRVNAALDLGPKSSWLLIKRSEPVRTPTSAGRVRWQLHYQFAPRAPAEKVLFAFPDLATKEKDEEERTTKFDPVAFQVTTVIGQADQAPLRGNAAIETLPDVPVKTTTWGWAAPAIGMLLLVASLLAVRRFLRRRPHRSHAQIALYELQRLIALRLPEQNRSERFITLLTVLIRRYLERQFGLRTRRQTTAEFVKSIATVDALTGEDKQFLTDFLQHCETVKYANQFMSLEECRAWAESARRFLQRHITA